MGIPVREIKGIGEKTEKLLARLEIETVDQLVHHYPRCYTTYPECRQRGEAGPRRSGKDHRHR